MNFQIFDSPEFDVYLGKREIKMQKTTEGLGVMIIEGSHKLLGKGIFVSDIQQKSLAFKVNLPTYFFESFLVILFI